MAGAPAGARRIGAFSIGFCGFRDSFIAMNRRAIIAKLRENEAALRARGVAQAALFGSHARGGNRPDSDIDILIDIAPDAPVGLGEYVGITQYLEDLPSWVDVATAM
jgi:predicted nucleotidyltransferase